MKRDYIDRTSWIDISRGFGIILVWAGHMPNLVPQSVRDLIFSFHMPLFFILSGLFYKMRPPGEMLKRSVRTRLFPYVVYSLLFILIDYMIYRDNALLIGSFQKFLSGQGGHDVLWFFFVLFLTENIFNLILYVTRKWCNVLRLTFVCVVSMVGYFMTVIGVASRYKFAASLAVMLYFCAGNVFGDMHAFEQEAKKLFSMRILMILICGGCSIGLVFLTKGFGLPITDINNSQFGFLPISFPCALCGSMFILLLSRELDGKLLIPIRYIGRNSLYFYPLGTWGPVRILDIICRILKANASVLLNMISKVLGYTMTFGISKLCEKTLKCK